jgi:hypothetical protein
VVRKSFIEFDSLTPGLKALLPKIDAAVSLVFDMAEPEAETYARGNASWTDRTGNARAGLGAKHSGVPMRYHELVIYHSMNYGIWLEVRFSGRYAIIGPTMAHMSDVLAANIATAIHHVTSKEPRP